jgi:translation initiation factor IF-1
MSHPDQIQARGKIVALLAHDAYRGELENGHQFIARLVAKSDEVFGEGDRVLFSFHPADLSRARILAKA